MTSIDVEQAYKQGIITFEQALQLCGMGAEVSEAVQKPEAKTPKAKTTRKRKARKAKPAPEVKTLKSGWKYHTPDNHALTAHQVKRLDDAVAKVRAAGFEKAEWRVVGKWAWIYPFSGEKGTGYSPAFKAMVAKVFKGTKWEWSGSRGAIVYKGFLK